MANMVGRRLASCLLGVLAGLAMFFSPASTARAACCLQSCPNPSIIACTSVGCPTDVIPNCPGQIVAESPGPTDTCGAGTFNTCPNSEDGACTDGVNNDAWVDGLTDCADPDCRNDPACCGGPGQPCCDDAPCVAPMTGECSDPGFVCSTDKVCVACGGVGEPCCLLGTNGSVQASCDGGLVCAGQTALANGTCSTVGTAPALSPTALALGSLLLLALGTWHIRRRAIR